jgi:hypothetical protein
MEYVSDEIHSNALMYESLMTNGKLLADTND